MIKSWLGVEPGTNPGSSREQVVCDKQDDSNHSQTSSHVIFNLGNRIDDEGVVNTPDDDARIKDAKTVSEVYQKGAALYAALVLGAHRSSCWVKDQLTVWKVAARFLVNAVISHLT